MKQTSRSSSPRKREARPQSKVERATGSMRTDHIIADGGYPPEAMRALEVVFLLAMLYMLVVWAVV